LLSGNEQDRELAFPVKGNATTVSLEKIIDDVKTILNSEELTVSVKCVLKQVTQQLQSLPIKTQKQGLRAINSPLNNTFIPASSIGCSVDDIIYLEDEVRKYIIAYSPVFKHKNIEFECSLVADVILESNIEVIHKLIELMCLQTLHIQSARKVILSTIVDKELVRFQVKAYLDKDDPEYTIRVENDSFMSALASSVGWTFKHVLENNTVNFELSFMDFNLNKAVKESAAQRQIIGHRIQNVLNMNANRDDEKSTLLIVEQNNELRNFLVSLFESEYNVVDAFDAKEALRMANTEIPDLVISDILLPDFDGFWLQNSLADSEITNHIPLLFLTAYVSEKIKMKALSLGTIDLIAKPFDAPQLILKVRNIIKKQLAYKKSLKENDWPIAENIENKQQPFINKLDCFLKKYLADSEFSVSTLASKMAMSERQLQRKLQAVSGCTPSEYVNNYKLKAAEKMLVSGYSITKTSESCGFSTNSYFSKSFKAVYGESPSRYKRRL